MIDKITIEGRGVGGGSDGVTVEVALRVGDELIARVGRVGELELLGDDGRRLIVELRATTRVDGLERHSESGTWERLSKRREAAAVREHAPGPHVRATLDCVRVRAGARVRVHGQVRERDDDGAVRRVAAVELTGLAAAPRRRESTGRDLGSRVVGAALAVLALFAWIRWIVVWPEHLAHPGLTILRVGLGAVCWLHASVWLAVAIRRPGGLLRMLPRFATGPEDVGNPPFAAVAFVFGLTVSSLFGLIGGLVSLEQIAAADSVLIRGPKGNIADGAGVGGAFASLGAVIGWVSLVLLEQREARWVRLFRSVGDEWRAREGRLCAGKLAQALDRSGMVHASIEGPLSIDSDGVVLSVATEGLVWGLDRRAAVEATPQRKRFELGRDAAVAIAGRLGVATTIAARGPESLLLIASPEAPVLPALARQLWTRRLILAIAPLGAIVSALWVLL